MRWGLVVCGAVISAFACAGYACTSDTFVGDDGGDSASDARGPVTQADYCDAEARFLAHCQVDAACAMTNLNNCGSVFAALNPALAAALVACIDKDQLDCKLEFGSMIVSPCVQSELAGYTNDSGALAQLASDFCKACDPGSATCAGKFASAPDQPGYIPSLFADSLITQVDNSCAKKLDGGVATAGDASLTCTDQFVLCDYILFGLTLPKDACQDGG